jgi:hypothetical protein
MTGRRAVPRAGRHGGVITLRPTASTGVSMLLVVVIALVLSLASCSSPASTSPTETLSGQPGISGQSTSTTSGSSVEARIAQTTSYEELKALYKQAIKDGDGEIAHLTGKRYIEMVPDSDEGYIWAVTGLLEMSKSNYAQIDDYLKQAFESVPDTQKLADAIKAAEPELGIAWPFVSDTVAADDLNTSGNTCGNMSAGGLAAIQGKWAYFSSQGDEGKLYKIELTTPSGCQKLCDDSVGFVNIIGDTIYYRNGSDGNSLYSIRTDGAERTKLGSDACDWVSVENGWIYFGTEIDGKAGLYRVKTDGTERTLLVPALTKYQYVSGEWVYYVIKEDKGSLWRVPAGGGEPQRLTDGFVYSYTIADGRLYYLADADKWLAVYAAEADGSAKKEIYTVAGKISCFNVFKGSMFVSVRPEATNKDVIEVLDVASQKVVKELDAVTEGLYCAEQVLVYTDWFDGNRLYRVDLNNWNVSKIDQ